MELKFVHYFVDVLDESHFTNETTKIHNQFVARLQKACHCALLSAKETDTNCLYCVSSG
jgi:hypothetical protein